MGLGLGFNYMYNIKMISTKKILLRVILMASLIIIPVISFAQGNVPGPCDTSGKICNPLAPRGIVDLNTFIKTFLQGALRIGIPLIALAIIYSGFLFVAARGNTEKIGKAKDALLYTVIGAAILLGSWAIAKLISSTVLAL